MRKLVALLSFGLLFGLFAAFALPASAQGPGCVPVQNGSGAATCTVNFKDVPTVMTVTAAPPCLSAGTIFWTVTGVFHITLNKLQDPVPDSWFTGTETGPFTFTPDGASQSTLAGHGTSWFGSENNNQNNVQHFTVNFEGQTATGTVKFHIDANATTTPSGEVTMHFDQFARCN